jgi:glycosyltransferase involved in cell wall biosynthesis
MGDDADVRFIPFGVDTNKWLPEDVSAEVLDVLSIGADPMRDFGLLTEYAQRNPEVGVSLVTGRECAAELGPLPPNMRVRIRVPIEELKGMIARARVVVLPVKENTYSGATTTLLQCMAMGKAVAVSRVGAIREGYGLQDGVNVRWIESGSLESLSAAVNGLLADRGLRRRLGTAARRHVVENLNWDRYAAEMEKCLVGKMKCKEDE